MSGGQAPTPGEHEIRVSGCIADGCVILRCSCAASWSVEAGHTVAELAGLAAQHGQIQAPGCPSPVPLSQGEGRPG